MELDNKQLSFDEIIYEQIDTDKYIYKSNNLIESSYRLSINAQRLIYMCAKKLKPIYVKSNIKPSQMNTFLANQTFGQIKIFVTEFKEEFGLKGNYLYDALEQVVKELWEEEIQYLDNKGDVIKKRWVITCGFDEKRSYITMSFHPDLILDLLVFKTKYGKMQSDVTKQLKTSDQIRTYELLKNSLHKGKRRISLLDYRYKLAIPDDLYPKYTKLKHGKILPAIKAINENTEIEVYDYKEIRHGRSVGEIEFYIRQKNHNETVDDDYVDEIVEQSHVDNVKEIIKTDISVGTVSKITNMTIEAIRKFKVDMTVYEYIKEKVNVIQEYEKINPIKSYIGILSTAIKENWQLNIDEVACDIDEVSPKGNYTSNNSKRISKAHMTEERYNEILEHEKLLLGLDE